jgi:hypothetical protein
VGHSGGIMRTGPRRNTPRWRSRSDRSGSGAPIGPSSVPADSHTAALAGLESNTFALAVAAVCPRYATVLLVGPLTRNLPQWQEAFGLGVCS